MAVPLEFQRGDLATMAGRILSVYGDHRELDLSYFDDQDAVDTIEIRIPTDSMHTVATVLNTLKLGLQAAAVAEVYRHDYGDDGGDVDADYLEDLLGRDLIAIEFELATAGSLWKRYSVRLTEAEGRARLAAILGLAGGVTAAVLFAPAGVGLVYVGAQVAMAAPVLNAILTPDVAIVDADGDDAAEGEAVEQPLERLEVARDLEQVAESLYAEPELVLS